MRIRPSSSLQKPLVCIIILLSSSKAIGSFSWSSRFLARNSLLTMTSTSPRRSRRLTTTTASIALESSNIKSNLKAVPISAAATADFSSSNADADDVSSSSSSRQELILLQDWMDHDEASYHHFSPETAETIRNALLEWYQGNRRKLPWRGDPPPYDGSTAGINNGKRKQTVKQELETSSSSTKKKQANITNFFATTSNSSSTTTTTTSTTTTTTKSKKLKDEKQQVMLEQPLQEAIPQTGYGVWVSEIMLQQTRVEAVIPYWLKWMKSFPTVYELAAASEEQVNSHWAGLGFYRRARLLHKGAKHVVTELDGQLPQTPDALLNIDGIGPYTAAAISSIAYNASVAVVDGNVCRVLSRLTGIANHIKSPIFKDKLGWDLATQLVQAGGGKDAGQVNQALMELGATYCAPSGTGVDPRDPLREFYLSCQLGRAYAAYASSVSGDETVYKYKATSTKTTTSKCALCNPDGIEHVLRKFQEELNNNNNNNEPVDSEAAAKCGHAIFPLDPPKIKKREEDLAVGALCNTWNEETWWLLTKRPKEGLLAGQWEFPSALVQTRHDKKSKTQQPPKANVRRSALDQLLFQLTNEEEWICELKRVPVDPAPLEHIFSHVKHIMWIECASSAMEVDGKEWTTSDGKQVRWFRENDMKQVGITSGLKKVIKAVKEQQQATAPRKRAKR